MFPVYILFNEILERYEKEIFNYCFQKLSHDKFMAEEVFDDVFMNLYKKWEHLVIGKDIRAYLYRTADILIKERLRKESRYYRFNYSLEESEEVNPQQQQSTLDTYSQVDIPSTNADDFLESPYMQNFKQGLSPQDRLLYELRIEKHMTLSSTTHIWTIDCLHTVISNMQGVIILISHRLSS